MAKVCEIARINGLLILTLLNLGQREMNIPSRAVESALSYSSGNETRSEVWCLGSFQSCWNCGRKASETCSGCNIARYCGSFCQHKDWERHHRICGQSLHSQSKPLALPAGRSTAAKAIDGVSSPALEKTSAATSRSSTPASVTAIETNGL